MRVTGSDGKQYTIEPEADLSGADLRMANLTSADLTEANLSNANLDSAILRMANLNGANLNGANLNGANLDGANLTSADLTGANLNRVKYDGQTVFPVGFPDPLGLASNTSSSEKVTGIGLLRALAWIWLILCPVGGIVFWVEWAELEKGFGFDKSMLGFELFIVATLSGVVTFAVFLVLCTIAENLIAIKKAVTSNTVITRG